MEEIIKAIVIPILFIFFNGLVEVLLATSPDFENPGAIKISYTDGSNRLEHLTVSPAKLVSIKDNYPSIVHIRNVVSIGTFHWWNYPSISLNLYFAALSAGSVAFFSSNVTSFIEVYKPLYPLHIGLLIIIILICIRQRNARDETDAKQFGICSLALSFVTAVTTLILLRDAL